MSQDNKPINNLDDLMERLKNANRDLFFANNGSGTLPKLDSPKVYINTPNGPELVLISVDYTAGCIYLESAANQ
jgi:hypothetical protein